MISAFEATRRSGIFKLLEQRELQISAYVEVMKFRQWLIELSKSREAMLTAGISVRNIHSFSNLRKALDFLDSRDLNLLRFHEKALVPGVDMSSILREDLLEEEYSDEETSEPQPSYIA